MLKEEKSCETCGNARFRIANNRWECQLPENELYECIKGCGCKWVEQEGIEGIITADILAEDVAGLIYKQGKAKILNLLESQLEDNSRLFACKRIANDIIATIAKDAADLIKDVLSDWQVDIVGYGEIADPEEAEKERKEIKSALK